MSDHDPKDPLQTFRSIGASDALMERWQRAARRAKDATAPNSTPSRPMFVRWAFWIPVLGALLIGILVGRQTAEAPAENLALDATVERIIAKSE